MIDASPNAGAEKFVAAKYSSGKVLSLHYLSNLAINLVYARRKFIRYMLMKDLRSIYIFILFIVSFFLVWCRSKNKCVVF